jgi:hypothetical protein
VLEERFTERPIPEASLLIARIQVARGDDEEARRIIDWVERSCPPDGSVSALQAFYLMLRLVLYDRAEGAKTDDAAVNVWGDAVEKARGGSSPEELLEVLYWRARVSIRNERWEDADCTLKEAEERLDECSMWRLRFADLMSRSLLRQPTSISADSRPG